MLLLQQKEECPPAIHPELSSLIDYLNKHSYTTIYGPASNFIFQGNILSNRIPPIPIFGIRKVLENGARPNLDIQLLGCSLPYYFG